jgi:hypothetical protein
LTAQASCLSFAEHGPGLNHILARRYADGAEQGIDPPTLALPVIQSGNFGSEVGYSCLDGRAEFSAIIEVARGSSAAVGIPPDELYPPESD